MASSDPVPTVGDPSRRPVLVDVAAWSYVAIAVANLLVGARMVGYVPAVVADYERAGEPVPTQAVILATATIGGAAVLFSAALIVFALRLRAGSTWARPILLTVSLLSLASLLVGGGPSIVIIALCVVAAIVVTRPAVGTWLRARREPPLDPSL